MCCNINHIAGHLNGWNFINLKWTICIYSKVSSGQRWQWNRLRYGRNGRCCNTVFPNIAAFICVLTRKHWYILRVIKPQVHHIVVNSLLILLKEKAAEMKYLQTLLSISTVFLLHSGTRCALFHFSLCHPFRIYCMCLLSWHMIFLLDYITNWTIWWWRRLLDNSQVNLL